VEVPSGTCWPLLAQGAGGVRKADCKSDCERLQHRRATAGQTRLPATQAAHPGSSVPRVPAQAPARVVAATKRDAVEIVASIVQVWPGRDADRHEHGLHFPFTTAPLPLWARDEEWGEGSIAGLNGACSA